MFARRRADLLFAALLVLAAAGLGLLFVQQHADRSFIAYRFAQNLAAGQGFAYNAGQPVLSDAAAPLYVVLLSLVAAFTRDLPLAGNVIGIASIALGALALYLIAQESHPSSPHRSEGESEHSGRLPALLAAALYLTSPLLWAALGLEAALWMALALWAVWLHGRQHGAAAALLLALATLTRPEAAVLAVVLVASAVLAKRPLRVLPAALYTGIVALGMLWLNRSVDGGGMLPGFPVASGDLLPPDVIGADALSGLAALALALLALSPLWAVALIPAALGTLRLRRHGWALLLAAWAALHLITLISLRVAVYPWHFAPLIPALAALVPPGAEWAAGRIRDEDLRWLPRALVALVLAGAAALSLYRLAAVPSTQPVPWEDLLPAPVEEGDVQAGAWLAANTPPGAVVGTARAGVLGYVSRRALVDLQGTLQPDVAQARLRGDELWALSEYRPDYLVLRGAELEALSASAAQGDRWLSLAYAEAARFPAFPGAEESVIILARTVEAPPLVAQPVGMVRYADGIVLNGIATDFSIAPLEGGRAGRVRLEWLLEQPVSGARYVSIAITGRDGTVAALGGRALDFHLWPTRRLITSYHTLDLAAGLPPGAYDLQVGIGADAFTLAWQTVALAKVPFPEAAFIGAVSGAGADYGDIALLGYRLTSSAAGLEVLLMWQAASAPHADYRVVIHVRDAQGVVVAQSEAEPHGGAYPTSVWSPGERVPDTVLIDTTVLPPGEYAVYVGLLDPDGVRRLTLDGQDAVMVGRVAIGGE